MRFPHRSSTGLASKGLGSTVFDWVDLMAGRWHGCALCLRDGRVFASAPLLRMTGPLTIKRYRIHIDVLMDADGKAGRSTNIQPRSARLLDFVYDDHWSPVKHSTYIAIID